MIKGTPSSVLVADLEVAAERPYRRRVGSSVGELVDPAVGPSLADRADHCTAPRRLDASGRGSEGFLRGIQSGELLLDQLNDPPLLSSGGTATLHAMRRVEPMWWIPTPGAAVRSDLSVLPRGSSSAGIRATVHAIEL